MDEFQIMRQCLLDLDESLSLLRKKRLGLHDKRLTARIKAIKDSLLHLKTNLAQVNRKLKVVEARYSRHSIGLAEDICDEIDYIHTNIRSMSVDLLEERVDLIRRMLASLEGSIPKTLLELQVDVPDLLGRLPSPLRAEVAQDFVEVQRCYEAGAYRAVISFCGRILEVVLGRWYFEERRKSQPSAKASQIEQEISGLTIGQLIRRCEQMGLQITYPGIDDYANLINRTRVPAIHHKGTPPFHPGPNAARGVVELTVEVIKDLYVL